MLFSSSHTFFAVYCSCLLLEFSCETMKIRSNSPDGRKIKNSSSENQERCPNVNLELRIVIPTTSSVRRVLSAIEDRREKHRWVHHMFCMQFGHIEQQGMQLYHRPQLKR
ncbi:hypothetical protein L1887_13608 [Cichorium endivia]|nr:hypothetical protein L1887_13608 [Cichorium endivia]